MNPWMDERLIEASKKGDIVKVKSLLKEGANVNAKDYHGNTSLILSSKYSNTSSSDDMVRLLINEGADVNAKTNKEQTSLMIASVYSDTISSLDTIRLLLDNGANVNEKDNHGRTSLIYASAYSNGTSSLATVSLLLDKGANVNSKDSNGQTSLMFASAHSNSTSSSATAELLLDNGADVGAKTNNGQTSLMFASANSNNYSPLDIIRLLLDRGADPFVKDSENKYPLDICKTTSCKKIISTSMWNIMNNNVKLLSGQYSTKTPISKNVWELILLKNKQRQLCRDLSKEENKYVLRGFATMLSIPIAEKMTKRQLCNLVSKQLSWGGKYSQESVKYFQRKEKLATIGKNINNWANSLGINIDQPFDKIWDDISAMVGTLTTN